MAVESLRLTFPQARQPQSAWIRFSFTGFTIKTRRRRQKKGNVTTCQNVPQAAVRSKHARSSGRWVGECVAHVGRLLNVSERLRFCRSHSPFCFLVRWQLTTHFRYPGFDAMRCRPPVQAKASCTDTVHAIKGSTWPPFSDVYFSSQTSKVEQPHMIDHQTTPQISRICTTSSKRKGKKKLVFSLTQELMLCRK